MVSSLLNKSIGFLAAGGGVMIPLLCLSCWMWWLILKKALTFAAWRRQERSLEACFSAFGAQEPVGSPWQEEVMKIASGLSLTAWGLDRSRIFQLTRGLEREVGKGLATIGVLAAIAPFLGLLGTLCGMIDTFEIIAVFGTGRARPMASGISEALISTQTGLLVAVPGLVLGALLKRRAEALQVRIRMFCLAAVREFRSQKGHGPLSD